MQRHWPSLSTASGVASEVSQLVNLPNQLHIPKKDCILFTLLGNGRLDKASVFWGSGIIPSWLNNIPKKEILAHLKMHLLGVNFIPSLLTVLKTSCRLASWSEPSPLYLTTTISSTILHMNGKVLNSNDLVQSGLEDVR